MIVRELNDLHLEHHDWTPPRVVSDVTIIAGDANCGMHALPWMKKHFGDTHILYVMGNHEWYNHAFPSSLKKWKQLAHKHGIYILNNDEIVIEKKVRFLGATLWTDFNINGDQEQAMEIAKRKVWDYEAIRYNDFPGIYRKLKPEDILAAHKESLQWLTEKLNTPFDGKTVVITHHPPHKKSLNKERYKGTAHDPYYASDLEYLLDGDKVQYWFHGHTHLAVDYVVNGTRIISNPRGYPGQEKNFNHILTFDI